MTGCPELIHADDKRGSRCGILSGASPRPYSENLPRWPLPPLRPKRAASSVAGLRCVCDLQVEVKPPCVPASSLQTRHSDGSSGYADIGITADMPSPGLCRILFKYLGWRRSSHVLIRHNQRPSRKANSLSSGRYRVGLTPRGSVHESAFSFKRMSAWRYTLVVSGDSCPSQSAITERSTPW